jgi:aspartyl-tRNA(Asn)/glutamyl-tRNA(Gln) amidotransferase subunit A
MSQLTQSDVATLRALLDAREVSAVELAQAYLNQIALDRHNAFIDVRPELTLEQARHADQRLAQGDRSPLLGIPLAHKDIFATQGWRSTAGSKMLAQYVSPFDATVVERLAGAGAVCLGKTNCDEFAMGSANENSFFGPTRNPWNAERIPGGSSGGSAAAVAASLAPLCTGTDTGGSVRQPAAMCGITGIKPTYGAVSRFGMIAFASSLDQAGAMGKSALDCAALLEPMLGFDPRDSTCAQHEHQALLSLVRTTSPEALKGLRLGLPRAFFPDALASGVREVVHEALQVLKQAGAHLIDIDLPNTELAIPAYYVIAPAEASSNLSRFDGVRYGHRAENPIDLNDLYERSRSEGFGPEVQRRILVGAYVLSEGYYDAYYLQAQKVRRLIAQDFERAFGQVDLIVGPVSPTTAWPIGERFSDPVANYLSDVFTLPASMAGLPCLSVPAGFSEGMPVGLQMIGPAFAEARLLQAAHGFQQLTDWHRHHPGAGK